MEETQYKKKRGDKRDGRLITRKELDTNHFVMPLLWPRRTTNEAYFNFIIDLTKTDEYIKKNNMENDTKLSIFIVYLAALAKTFILRPKMNRFYRNGRLYERYKTSIGFIVKKSLTDEGLEALARVYVDPEDTILTFAKKVKDVVDACKGPQLDKSSDDLRILMKFPHFIGKLVMAIMRGINRRHVVPESVSASDIFFCSIAVSNLGSIGLHSGYHHLSDWGTNSFLATLGEKKKRQIIDKEGNLSIKESVDVGMTIDETIADGYYFSKSIKLMREFFENPELLEKPFKEEI